jgi:hypothetical protein
MQSAGSSNNGSSAGKARHTLKKAAIGVLSALSLLAASPAVQAETEFKLGDEAGLTAGIGIRSSFNMLENGSPGKDFTIDNARLFFSGHYGKVLKGTLNLEKEGSGGNTDGVLDAYIGLEFNDYFNIWFGRHLPPQDRANGYGPFYALPWDYPLVASAYPNQQNGRDEGITFWGKLFSGKLVWAGGAYDGHNHTAAASPKLAYSGRVAYHIWDPEPAPAYLAGGWYGGSKDILTIGLGGFSQKDAAGANTPPVVGKLNIWNVDVLFEKKFSIGVPTLEGAYYEYGVHAPDGVPAGRLYGPGFGVATPGKSQLLGAAWLFNGKVGWGQLQPFYRYQIYKPDIVGLTDSKQQDFGVNYIIKGPNAKVTAEFSQLEFGPVPGTKQDRFILGVQLVY